MSKRHTVTMDEVEADENEGICVVCGNRQRGCEPDAEKYECEDCGEREVYGLEQAVLCGLVNVVSDGDEEE